MNPDIHPPLKGMASPCVLISSPVQGDCVQGVHEVSKQADRCWSSDTHMETHSTVCAESK